MLPNTVRVVVDSSCHWATVAATPEAMVRMAKPTPSAMTT
jgi:hypothetical protein